MSNLDSIIRDLEEQRNSIDRAIQVLAGLRSGAQTKAPSPSTQRRIRRLSPAARARIAAAQRARWAKVRAAKKK